jgi:hypothetical protein
MNALRQLFARNDDAAHLPAAAPLRHPMEFLVGTVLPGGRDGSSNVEAIERSEARLTTQAQLLAEMRLAKIFIRPLDACT